MATTPKEKATAKAAETKANAKATEVEEKEETPEEALAAAIKEDGLRVPKGVNLVSVLGDLTARGVELAKVVKRRRKAEAEARKELAFVLLTMRQNIILPSGVPDWAGKTATYKAAVFPITGAAHYEGEGDSQVTTYNALNKAAQRLLPDFVATFVLVANPDLELDEEDALNLVKQGPAAAENKDDAKAQQLIALVNEQYAAQWAGEKERPRNAPRSPFESKESRSRTTPTGEEADGTALYKAALAIVEATKRKTMTLDVITEVIALAGDAMIDRIGGKEPHFGEGKPVVERNVGLIVALFTGVGIALERTPTKPEREAIREARAQVEALAK